MVHVAHKNNPHKRCYRHGKQRGNKGRRQDTWHVPYLWGQIQIRDETSKLHIEKHNSHCTLQGGGGGVTDAPDR
jgi:hypothetical protein